MATLLALAVFAGASPSVSQQAPQATVDPSKPFYEFPPTVSIERDDKLITAVKYGPDEPGLSAVCQDDERELTTTVFYDVLPYRVHVTVDKNVIMGPVAFVTKKEGGDGHLEVYNGTASPPPEGSDECAVVTQNLTPHSVIVEQGKTRLTGSKLVYDESDGLAVVSGPIVFERPQGDDDRLTGKSERITIDVDEEKTLLEGNVTLDSRCRTSKADRVEYDDRRNLAILFGKPAVSTEKGERGEVRGERLEYNLETNDVVVTAEKGGVAATFLDDEGGCE